MAFIGLEEGVQALTNQCLLHSHHPGKKVEETIALCVQSCSFKKVDLDWVTSLGEHLTRFGGGGSFANHKLCKFCVCWIRVERFRILVFELECLIEGLMVLWCCGTSA